jgi:hypothetical protein
VLEKRSKKTTGKEVGMGERAVVVALTAVVLVTVVLLYIVLMR